MSPHRHLGGSAPLQPGWQRSIVTPPRAQAGQRDGKWSSPIPLLLQKKGEFWPNVSRAGCCHRAAARLVLPDPLGSSNMRPKWAGGPSNAMGRVGGFGSGQSVMLKSAFRRTSAPAPARPGEPKRAKLPNPRWRAVRAQAEACRRLHKAGLGLTLLLRGAGRFWEVSFTPRGPRSPR